MMKEQDEQANLHTKKMPPKSLLNELIEYDPISGNLSWRKRQLKWFAAYGARNPAVAAKIWNSKFSGKPAFVTRRGKYLSGKLFHQHFYSHRIIWKMVHGEDPIEVDHIDGNKSNNSISNLREASRNTNLMNRPLTKRNTSGITGVWFSKGKQKWTAAIKSNSKAIYLGVFDSKNDAAKARRDAEIMIGYPSPHVRDFPAPLPPSKPNRKRRSER
jgi:hypothetical protein